MKVLVVGNGGREHAIIWKLKQSVFIEEIYCAPGNGGIAAMAECVDIDVTDTKKLVRFALDHVIDLTIIGPELPLTLGIVDEFHKKQLNVFGPGKKAAALEGSKRFAKEFMKKYNIPTAKYQSFTKAKDAIHFIHSLDPPFVVKADGLAAGKGVMICQTRMEGIEAVERIMKKKEFGKSGKEVVVEEFLTGDEASILVITDGEDYLVLPPSQDHKAIFEGDEGPNTGGMGAYAPAPLITKKLLKTICDEIIEPSVRGIKQEKFLFRGVLYAGLMITKDGPKVLEYNCRFGDPETQAVLPLIKNDMAELMLMTAEGNLKNLKLDVHKKSAVCVVIASGGYPGDYEKDKEIFGLDKASKDTVVFHAGTKLKKGQVLTSGGRVLGVTCMDDDLEAAVKKVYRSVKNITFEGAYYRKDIAHRALKKKK